MLWQRLLSASFFLVNFVDVSSSSTVGSDQVALSQQSRDHASLSNANQSCGDGVLLIGPIRDSLALMQDEYYQIWIGTWPTAIDWTAAVVNTIVTSTLSTFSGYLSHLSRTELARQHVFEQVENEINLYFAHNIGFYFAENAFNIRNEAYDDMLWVVLGWLESVKFIDEYTLSRTSLNKTGCAWYGCQYVAAFSHRARVFYDLASQGWDTKLCGGGMTWNPHLIPYKNAITNQLFISASIGMYLYFPGDDNNSPYLAEQSGHTHRPGRPHDERFLQAAINGYDWLRASNMTNEFGLYVDGYHITDWSQKNRTGSGKCDERNEMVFTYNQGVILSGLRGLYTATGEHQYLEDGHRLVRNVMNATGWRGSRDESINAANGQWQGLGRAGILEDYCDHKGDCSQDSQTFKGIFFDHLVQFCKSLSPRMPGHDLAVLHRQSCLAYGVWVEHNAQGALRNRDSKGRFGSFWGDLETHNTPVDLPRGAIDYRNDKTVLRSRQWSGSIQDKSSTVQVEVRDPEVGLIQYSESMSGHGIADSWTGPNDRGRGRTVETQVAGLSIVRAAWELNRL